MDILKQQPNYRFTKMKTLSSSSGAESEFVSLTSSWSKVYTLNSKAINQGRVKPPRTTVAIFKTGKRKLRQVLKSLGKNINDQGLSSCRLFEYRNWEVTAHTRGNITSWTPPFWRRTPPSGEGGRDQTSFHRDWNASGMGFLNKLAIHHERGIIDKYHTSLLF